MLIKEKWSESAIRSGMTICSQNDLNYGGGGHNMIDKASILRCDQETTDEPKTDRREQDDTIKANGRFSGLPGCISTR